MKTKLMITAGLVVLAVATASAQSKSTFGINGGVNFFNINGKDGNGDKLDNKLKTGFNVGVNAEIPVGIDFFIQPGIEYILKGADKVSGSDSKVNISYLQVPVNFLYKPDLGKGKLLLGFGPYFAFGAGGKYKSANGTSSNIKFKSDISPAEALSGNVYFKGFDAGADFLFGYECSNKLSLQLDALLGLVDINPKIDGVSGGKATSKNTGFGISLGYRF